MRARHQTPRQALTAPRLLDRADAAATVLLAPGTIAYLVTMPLNLVQYDEGYFLYHAVRVLHGEVLFRDILATARVTRRRMVISGACRTRGQAKIRLS
jgi:hypothetical protein